MTLTHKHSREALKHDHINVLELKSEYPIWKALIHIYCDFVEDLVNTDDTDIPNLHYKTSTKSEEYLYIGKKNLVWSFTDYFEYKTYDNGPIGDDWMKITNENFNNFRMKDYYNFRTLREARLVNPSPTLPTSSYKRHPPVYNLKRPIK